MLFLRSFSVVFSPVVLVFYDLVWVLRDPDSTRLGEGWHFCCIPFSLNFSNAATLVPANSWSLMTIDLAVSCRKVSSVVSFQFSSDASLCHPGMWKVPSYVVAKGTKTI